jgi:hypothetical protein
LALAQGDQVGEADGDRRVIWSLTPYFNERKVFAWRLAELEGIVDRHVVVEASVDHRGNPKERCFPQKWVHREDVDYRFIDLETGTNWHREAEQRRALATPEIADDDVVLLSDCDEIPRGADLARVAQTATETPQIMLLAMHVYRPQWRWKDLQPWYQICRVFKGSLLETDNPEEIRQMQVNESAVGEWPGLGWHMAYMGGPGAISRKLESFAHAELASASQNALRAYEEGTDLFGRGYHVVEETPFKDMPKAWLQ